MKIKNIIFSYPTQAVSRTDIFVNACRELKNKYGYNVVLTYNGPIIKGIDDIDYEHFETWLLSNKDLVQTASLIDLEKKYSQSNFWQPVVIERNLTDYSFTEHVFPRSQYKISEIEGYLKALILFYAQVIEKYKIQAAFNIVSDNIHSRVIQELSKSTSVIPFAIGRGIYWFDNMFYLNTSLNYGSRLLEEKYRGLSERTAQMSNSDLSRMEKYLYKIRENSASVVNPRMIYSKSAVTIMKNALKTIIGNHKPLALRKPSIIESNYKLQISVIFFSLTKAINNICWMRRNVVKRDLPHEPYVFLPLHYQPEASILGASPGWLDQLGLVRLISSSLPSGFRLVVKDHPAIGGLRRSAFYMNIMDLQNVVLLDDRVNSRVIMNHPGCRLLVTNGGTAGFEGMIFGKPLLIFGRAYYDCMKTLIRPPADINEMPNFMKDLLIHEKYPAPEVIENDVKAFLSVWLSIMKPVGEALPGASSDKLGAAKDWARVVDDLVKQIVESRLYI